MLYFRDQDLAPDGNYVSRGASASSTATCAGICAARYPEIHLISNVKEGERSVGSAYAGDDWRADLSFMKYSAHYAILHAIEVPVKDGVVWATPSS